MSRVHENFPQFPQSLINPKRSRAHSTRSHPFIIKNAALSINSTGDRTENGFFLLLLLHHLREVNSSFLIVSFGQCTEKLFSLEQQRNRNAEMCSFVVAFLSALLPPFVHGKFLCSLPCTLWSENFQALCSIADMDFCKKKFFSSRLLLTSFSLNG